MPYYSRIILNSFCNRLFPKLFRHNRHMPEYDIKETTKVLTSAIAMFNSTAIRDFHRPGQFKLNLDPGLYNFWEPLIWIFFIKRGLF